MLTHGLMAGTVLALALVQPSRSFRFGVTSSPSTAAPLLNAIECEDRNGQLDLTCSAGETIDIASSNYGRTGSADVCLPVDCQSGVDVDANVIASCQFKQSCSLVPHHDAINFGVDPCQGTFKYLEIDYACVSEDASVITVTECERQTLNIDCGAGATINVLTANYGRTDTAVCPGTNSGSTFSCYGENSMQIVTDACQGNQMCSLTFSNALHGSDPCRGVFKYLEVSYTCV